MAYLFDIKYEKQSTLFIKYSLLNLTLVIIIFIKCYIFYLCEMTYLKQ